MHSWYRDIVTSVLACHASSRPGRPDVMKVLVAGVAPPASHNANLEPVVEGPAISLAARNTKDRRAGYSA